MRHPNFLAQDIVALARALVGAELTVNGVGGRIVETEAYDASDPASHSFGGKTKRNAPMFGPPGRAYVYRIYGVHWCLNIVGGPQYGAAVLIRALEPLYGIDAMQRRRGFGDVRKLCAGPGRLCQALGVTADCNGLSITQAPFALKFAPPREDIAVGPRIGISKAADSLRRFGIERSPFLSRPFL